MEAAQSKGPAAEGWGMSPCNQPGGGQELLPNPAPHLQGSAFTVWRDEGVKYASSSTGLQLSENWWGEDEDLKRPSEHSFV